MSLQCRLQPCRIGHEAARVTDQESRSALYFQAAQKMLADVAMVPLWSTLTGTGVRAELKDYKQGPTGTAIYEDANFS